jgi:hypothetical protein
MNVADFGSIRRSIYVLLITVATATIAANILSVRRLPDPGLVKPSSTTATSPDADPPDPEDLDPNDRRGNWSPTRPRPMPSLGDNDRSRWATIRALVEDHTYVIGHQEVDPETGKATDIGIASKDGWRSIDKVRDPTTHDFYSSKPPFLPTLLAGEYWVLRAFGLSIVTDRWIVMRTILFTINWLPWVAYLWLLSRLVERYGTTDWGRLFVFTAACFGTLVSTFLNTLNNHTIAAFTALFALYPVLASARSPMTYAQLAMAGFFAAFTACSELPAATLAVTLFVWCLFRSPWRTLVCFVPAAAVPVAVFLITNWIAFQQFTPIYEKFGTDWYEYPGSHWIPEPGKTFGIDWAYLKEQKGAYAFHVLVGHHGLFSLTPVFLLGLAGMFASVVKLITPSTIEPSVADTVVPRLRPPFVDPRMLGILGGVSLLITVIVVGFYVFGVSDRSRNYGGWSIGPRWLIWLTPLFLLSMLPVCDWLAGRTWGRRVAYVLLAVSVLSASYSAWNPWRHPWLYSLIDTFGGIPY